MRKRKRSITWKILNMPLTAHKLGRILCENIVWRKRKLLFVIREVSLGLGNQLAASGIRWEARKKRKCEQKGDSTSSHWIQTFSWGLFKPRPENYLWSPVSITSKLVASRRMDTLPGFLSAYHPFLNHQKRTCLDLCLILTNPLLSPMRKWTANFWSQLIQILFRFCFPFFFLSLSVSWSRFSNCLFNMNSNNFSFNVLKLNEIGIENTTIEAVT